MSDLDRNTLDASMPTILATDAPTTPAFDHVPDSLLAERPAPASFVTMAELVASHRRDSERHFSETFGLDHDEDGNA